MKSIGALEAKKRLSELLDAAENICTRKERSLGGLSITEMIKEGRKY